MRTHPMQRSSLSRTTAFRSLLVVALLCIASAFFTLATPTAHAASPSSSIFDMLRRAGYVQIKPYSSTHSLTGRKIVPHVSNASPGPYQFTDNIFSLANSKYVAAELGYTGGNYAMLRACTASNSIGPWEQFFLYTLNGCNPVTTNCQSLILSAANNKLVSAELGYTGGNYAMLRARTDPNKAGPWEQFLV